MPASTPENATRPYAFDLEGLRTQRRQAGKLYLEFLRVPDLSGGLYVLEAGAPDPSRPTARMRCTW